MENFDTSIYPNIGKKGNWTKLFTKKLPCRKQLKNGLSDDARKLEICQ